MGDDTYRRLTEAILVAHQRRADSNCVCGALRLGDSWAAHVAAVLDGAGALRDRPPPAPGPSTAILRDRGGHVTALYDPNHEE